MHQSHTILVLAVSSLVVCGCLSRSLPEPSGARHRARRALGTMTLIQKELELALGRHLPQGCSEIGCQLLNPQLSGKKRRSYDMDAEDGLMEEENATKLDLLRELLRRIEERS